MSTNSTISVLLNDGSVRTVYCHWDGYVEHNGKLLRSYYNSQEDAELVTSLGSLSSLGKNLFPNGEHSFDAPEKDCTVAYSRDRGDDFYEEVFTSIEEYLGEFADEEFNYLWYKDRWVVITKDVDN